MICGDANPKGNLSMWFKGSCKDLLKPDDAYRCTGCGGYFHRDCIFNHFEQEENHSKTHKALRDILNIANAEMDGTSLAKIAFICRQGLDRSQEKISLLTNPQNLR